MEKGEAEQESYVCPFIPELITSLALAKGGYIFGSVGLSVCLFADNITPKVMNGFG